VQPDVELDEKRRFQPAPRERPRQAGRRCGAVDGDRQVDARRDDVGQPVPLVLPERRIVHEDRGRAGLLEHLRLARLRDREPACSQLELAAPDLGRLVRLRVRPQLDAVLVDI